MPEEQVKAAKAAAAEAAKEKDEEVEVEVEEISEDDLEGVAGGVRFGIVGDPSATICTCGEEKCDCLSCDSEATAG